MCGWRRWVQEIQYCSAVCHYLYIKTSGKITLQKICRQSRTFHHGYCLVGVCERYIYTDAAHAAFQSGSWSTSRTHDKLSGFWDGFNGRICKTPLTGWGVREADHTFFFRNESSQTESRSIHSQYVQKEGVVPDDKTFDKSVVEVSEFGNNGSNMEA